MPGIGGPEITGATTPGRRTFARFDVAENVLVEPAIQITRGRNGPVHIAGGDQPADRTFQCQRLASGFIGIAPRPFDLAAVHERTTHQGDIIPAGDWLFTPSVVGVPIFKKPDNVTMPGVNTGGAEDVQSSGDGFWTLRRTAGASWDDGLVQAIPFPPGPTIAPQAEPSMALDLVADGVVTYPEDQGYLIRFVVPGKQLDAHDRIFHFSFGGPLTAQGHGRFGLAFGGNGWVALHEYIDGQWVRRDEWQYAAAKDITDKGHVFGILPHARRYIEFRCQVADIIFPLFGQKNDGPPLGPPRISLPAHVYTVPDDVMRLKEGDDGQFVQGNFVTGQGPLQWGVRRDLRPYWQIARLLYPTGFNQGVLMDEPSQFPFGSGENVDFRWFYKGPRSFEFGVNSVSVAGTLYNAATNLPLPNPGGFLHTLPGDTNVVYPRFQLTASAHGVWSPWIEAYQLTKRAVIVTATPGEFESRLDALAIEGPTNVPESEGALVTIFDPKNELPRLKNRGRMAVEIVTELDGGPEETKLFRGYVARANANLRGRTGEWAAGKVLTFTERVDYQLQLSGAWTRLAEALSPGQPIQLYDVDELPTASGEYLPPKVTDIIRDLLRAAGYLDTQIDVPDLDMRFWIGRENSLPQLIPPFSSLATVIQQFASQYLGAHLIWDANAGTVPGMWRLRERPFSANLNPLWYFLTETPAAPAPRLVHTPGLWGENATFIRKDTYLSYPIRMEANAVWVTTQGDLKSPQGSVTSFSAFLWNPNSFDLPWSGVPTAVDPDHPDYIGSMILRPYFDPDLKTQAAVDFFCRYLYEITCRTRKGLEFVAPFFPVEDPDDAELAGRRRPLRYGDTVGVGPTVAEAAEYFVISCNPAWDQEGDHHAMQHLELQEVLT